MYNKYKNKYLLYKKMFGGTVLENSQPKTTDNIKTPEIFIKEINKILLNEDISPEEKFENIKRIIGLLLDKETSSWIYYKSFNDKSLFRIILDLNIDPNIIIEYIETIFNKFMGTFLKISFDFVTFIELTASKTNLYPIIISKENNFSNWINFVIFLKNITLLTDDVVMQYDFLKRKITNPKNIEGLDFYISKNNAISKIIESINIYRKLLLENLDIEQVIPTITLNFNVQIFSDRLIQILEKIIPKSNISLYYNFLLYIHTNINCVKNVSEPFVTICLILKDLINRKNLEELINLTSKTIERRELEPHEKENIYENYLQLLKFNTKEQITLLLKENSELIMQKILDSRFYYFPTTDTFNINFWEGIFTQEEIIFFQSHIKKSTSEETNTIELIKQIIPFYYSEKLTNKKQHSIIYTTLYIVGKLNKKINTIFNSKIVIKGGKALQFKTPKNPKNPRESYYLHITDDLDILVMSSNEFFAKSLSFNLSILVKWLLNINPLNQFVSIKFPNKTQQSPVDNINIVKISYLFPLEYIYGKGPQPPQTLAIVDIDFLQFNPEKNQHNFFSEEKLELIDLVDLQFYIQNLTDFTVEKIYYFIENCCHPSKNFFLGKFMKSIQYVFLNLFNAPDSTLKKIQTSFFNFIGDKEIIINRLKLPLLPFKPIHSQSSSPLTLASAPSSPLTSSASASSASASAPSSPLTLSTSPLTLPPEYLTKEDLFNQIFPPN